MIKYQAHFEENFSESVPFVVGKKVLSSFNNKSPESKGSIELKTIMNTQRVRIYPVGVLCYVDEKKPGNVIVHKDFPMSPDIHSINALGYIRTEDWPAWLGFLTQKWLDERDKAFKSQSWKPEILEKRLLKSESITFTRAMQRYPNAYVQEVLDYMTAKDVTWPVAVSQLTQLYSNEYTRIKKLNAQQLEAEFRDLRISTTEMNNCYHKRDMFQYLNNIDNYEEYCKSCQHALIESTKPAEVLIADDPESFIDMYASGVQSCMSNHHDWKGVFGDKTMPSVYYAFHPKTKGVYIKEKGKVVARCVIFDDKFYGRMYQSTSQHGSKLIKHMENVMKLKNIGHVSFDLEFEVPGQGKNKDILPVPYFDTLQETRAYMAKKNKDEPGYTFTVATGKIAQQRKKEGWYSGGDSGRAVSALNCIRAECSVCKTATKDPVTSHTHHDRLYCSGICAKKDKHIDVLMADGSVRYVEKGNEFNFRGTTYFNILHAIDFLGVQHNLPQSLIKTYKKKPEEEIVYDEFGLEPEEQLMPMFKFEQQELVIKGKVRKYGGPIRAYKNFVKDPLREQTFCASKPIMIDEFKEGLSPKFDEAVLNNIVNELKQQREELLGDFVKLNPAFYFNTSKGDLDLIAQHVHSSS